MKNTALDATALTLSIIGAVNWGLIGLFKFDLVAFLFGSMTLLSRIKLKKANAVFISSAFMPKKNKGASQPPVLLNHYPFILLS